LIVCRLQVTMWMQSSSLHPNTLVQVKTCSKIDQG
jgi:hypothetical protein